MKSPTRITKRSTDTAVARALGLASIGIGLTEIAAPRQLERLMGIGNGNGQNTSVLRLLGVREILQGVDILCHDDPAPGVKARVAGDLIDGVLLGVAATKTRRPTGLLAVCAAVLPIVLLDMIFAKRLSRD
jgi:hypothetical protein